MIEVKLFINQHAMYCRKVGVYLFLIVRVCIAVIKMDYVDMVIHFDGIVHGNLIDYYNRHFDGIEDGITIDYYNRVRRAGRFGNNKNPFNYIIR